MLKFMLEECTMKVARSDVLRWVLGGGGIPQRLLSVCWRK